MGTHFLIVEELLHLSRYLVNSYICRSGAHCGTCRDRAVGAEWRRGICLVYNMPTENFECPHGRSWGYQPDPGNQPAKPMPRDPAACEDCPNCVEGNNAVPACKLISRGKPCRYSAFLRGEIDYPEACPLKPSSEGIDKPV
jgi:hypothetical protein